MTDPLFWLVLSLLFVTISLTIVLLVALPAFKELARASRSAEKLFDTLRRELPPTLQAIRLTGLELSELTEDVSEGAQSVGQVVKQVDQSLTGVRQQAQRVQSSTRSVAVGLTTAWKTFTRAKPLTQRRASDRLPLPRPEAKLGHAAREPAYPDEALADLRTNARPGSPDAENLSQSAIARDPAAANDLDRPSTNKNKLSTP